MAQLACLPSLSTIAAEFFPKKIRHKDKGEVLNTYRYNFRTYILHTSAKRFLDVEEFEALLFEPLHHRVLQAHILRIMDGTKDV